ncbi:hypothetical protein [Pantoea ananatis]|uniref:hypothetical protein n=2 Tax=Pantoea ananas TaxID=553 RepID=UPI0023510061|nr:hypothetical protein [Pantoea ananatis]
MMTAMNVALMYPFDIPADLVRKKDLHTATLQSRLPKGEAVEKFTAEVIPMAYYGMITPW